MSGIGVESIISVIFRPVRLSWANMICLVGLIPRKSTLTFSNFRALSLDDIWSIIVMAALLDSLWVPLKPRVPADHLEIIRPLIPVNRVKVLLGLKQNKSFGGSSREGFGSLRLCWILKGEDGMSGLFPDHEDSLGRCFKMDLF